MKEGHKIEYHIYSLVTFLQLHFIIMDSGPSRFNINMPYSVTHLDCASIFESCGKGGSKNTYQKHIFSEEVGVHAQNMIVILNRIVNIIGGNLYIC